MRVLRAGVAGAAGVARGAPGAHGRLDGLDALVGERRHSKVLEHPLVAPRRGVMLHYDDSTRDDWALAWFSDPRCRNGYTWLVLDDGRVVELADPRKRTPHAGACRTPNANSAFYGIAAATNGLVPATPAQVDAIAALCVALARWHAWPGSPRGSAGAATAAATAAAPWIVGHDAEAIWTPAGTRAAGMADARGRALWGRGGRKVDPTGVRGDRVPIIDVNDVRRRVALGLAPRAGEE